MSALTERIGHYHRAWSIESTDTEDPGIECRCTDSPERMDWTTYAAHIAEVTEAETRAAVLAEFEQHDERHWCTKACPDGCDVAVTRVWTRREVIERDEPLTEEDIAALRDRFPDLFREKGQP